MIIYSFAIFLRNFTFWNTASVFTINYCKRFPNSFPKFQQQVSLRMPLDGGKFIFTKQTPTKSLEKLISSWTLNTRRLAAKVNLKPTAESFWKLTTQMYWICILGNQDLQKIYCGKKVVKGRRNNSSVTKRFSSFRSKRNLSVTHYAAKNLFFLWYFHCVRDTKSLWVEYSCLYVTMEL